MKLPENTKLINREQLEEIIDSQTPIVVYNNYDASGWLYHISNSSINKKLMDETNCDFAINMQDYYLYFGIDIFLDEPSKSGFSITYYNFNNQSLYFNGNNNGSYNICDRNDVYVGSIYYGDFDDCKTFLINHFTKHIPEWFPFKINFIFQ